TERKGRDLAYFLLEKVEIIRTEVPKDTDLNHYFEIMNIRGEQLEKHEILKARLLEILPEGIQRSVFAQIWDACSDMSRYALIGIESGLRSNIFGKDWQGIPKLFNDIIQDYKINVENTNKKVKVQQDADSTGGQLSILDLIDKSNEQIVQPIKNNEFSEGSFNSVIDFPNFLMHVLRIYLELRCDDSRFKDVSLDERELLNSFGKDWSKENVIDFIDTLLSCRYLFDKYVIKSSTLRSEDEHWSLWKIVKGSSNNYYYKNTFGGDNNESNDTESNEKTKTAIMLLSMFHVSNPSRIYKNWLYAVLRALYTHREKIRFNSYIRFLEKLCDNFYFGNNCQEKDITDIILGEEKINFYSNNKKWNDGVLVPNFVFNRLDYQLWKKYKEKYPKFRFTFRSSVEHHYPQHPSEEYGLERLEKKILDNFGNLYLLSQSKNSRLSNLTPEAKCSYYKNKNYDSLKQALMMEKTKELNNWKNEEILKHGEEMLEILNQPLSKADS
ncbi:TPA: HNH endonuclease family protein, partial [Haemophilus influenzae]